MVDSDEGSAREKENYRESLGLLRKFLSNNEWNVGRNVDGKGHADEPQMRMRNMLLETGGKAVLVIQCHRT